MTDTAITGVLGLDHVGVLTADLDAVRRLAALLGIPASATEVHPELGVEVVWLELGGVRVEVLRPTDPGGRAAQAMAAGRTGLDHVAFAVDDCAGALAALRGCGVDTRDGVPRPGVHGTRVGFLDEDGTGGLRVELVEHPTS
jgi:methylmalonyl-CoA/ethylmalonyl-CoA epimerase